MERCSTEVPYTPPRSVYDLAFFYSINLFLFDSHSSAEAKKPNNLAIVIDKLISSCLPDGTMF